MSTDPFPLQPTPIHVPDYVLADLRQRLALTRWPVDAGNEDWYYGVNRDYLQELVEIFGPATDSVINAGVGRGCLSHILFQPPELEFFLAERYQFYAAGRPGFYVGVTQEGAVEAGDEIRVIARDPNAVSIAEIFRLYSADSYEDQEIDVIQRALRVPSFPERWRKHFRERLAKQATV